MSSKRVGVEVLRKSAVGLTSAARVLDTWATKLEEVQPAAEPVVTAASTDSVSAAADQAQSDAPPTAA
ncbi:MAG: hypothetical protein U0271_21900 [Polyangiaceae bacterium]